MPTHVPAETRDHLATPCGLLFNELLKSPKVDILRTRCNISNGIRLLSLVQYCLFMAITALCLIASSSIPPESPTMFGLPLVSNGFLSDLEDVRLGVGLPGLKCTVPTQGVQYTSASPCHRVLTGPQSDTYVSWKWIRVGVGA